MSFFEVEVINPHFKGLKRHSPVIQGWLPEATAATSGHLITADSQTRPSKPIRSESAF